MVDPTGLESADAAVEWYASIHKKNEGWQISQKYASHELASKGYYPESAGYHTGVDLKQVNKKGKNITKGAVVYPEKAGKIVQLRDSDPGIGFGKYIGIQHEDGKVTEIIAHMDSLAPELKKGSFVDRTTALGTAGNTGNSTGAHVHKELQRDVSSNNKRTVGLAKDGNVVQKKDGYDRITSPVGKSWFMGAK
jgi:murein DD-endopeptidase MepM/ murein hydrolase activator NlpD